MLFLAAISFMVTLAGGGGITSLDYTCYPNEAVAVIHPSSYSHVLAVQDQGESAAVKCSVTTTGFVSMITGCSQDNPIVVFFTNRAGDLDIFGSNDYVSYEIECSNIPDSGIERTVANLLGATLEVTTQDAATPSFAISSAFRRPTQLGDVIYDGTVGETVYWTIDVPSDYTARPTCTAYSGTDSSGTPSKLLVQDGCREDTDLLGDDFDNYDASVSLIHRYYVTLHVFKFYNNNDVYFWCTVKVCPSGSSACDTSCGKRKRSVGAMAHQDGDRTFTTSSTLHILPYTESSAASVIGSLWLAIATMLMALIR